MNAIRSVLCPFCGQRLHVYFEWDCFDEMVVGHVQHHDCPDGQTVEQPGEVAA